MMHQALMQLTTLDNILTRCDTILRSLPGARAEVRVYGVPWRSASFDHTAFSCALSHHRPHSGVGDMFTESTSLRRQLTHKQKELERIKWEESLKQRRAQLGGPESIVAIDTAYKVRHSAVQCSAVQCSAVRLS